MNGIEYTLSNPFRRFVALMVDSIFIQIATIIIIFITGQGDVLVSMAQVSSLENIESIMNSFMPLIQTMTIIQLILGIAYYGVFQAQFNGASLGKKLLGIRIVTMDGSEFTIMKGILRYIVNAIVMQLCFIFGAFVFFTQYKQALHDMVVKTVVVNE